MIKNIYSRLYWFKRCHLLRQSHGLTDLDQHRVAANSRINTKVYARANLAGNTAADVAANIEASAIGIPP